MLSRLLILLIFVGCVSKKRCKELCTTDTITINVIDTINIESITHDTILSVKFDTILISKDKLQVKLIRVRDSIIINANCKGDTLYIYKQVKAPVQTYNFTKWEVAKKYWQYLLLILFIGIIIGVILRK